MGFAAIVAIEVACVVIVWRVAVRANGAAIGPLFVTVAFIFHGVAEVARVLLPPPRSTSTVSEVVDLRRFTSDDSMQTWNLWAMLAIVVFSAVYVALTLWRSRPVEPEPMPTKLASFPWFVTAPIAFILWPAMLRSSQAETPISIPPADGSYWASGLANQFLVLLTILAVVDFSLRRGARWQPALAAIMTGSIFILIIGERAAVVSVAVISIGALWWYGARPTARVAAAMVAFIVLCTVTLTLARSQAGRQEFERGGATDRVTTLAQATNAITDTDSALAAGSEIAVRFDGNAFPSVVVEAERSSPWRTGWAPFSIGAQLAVPSFVDPGKAETTIHQRSEKVLMIDGFGLRINRDFLPTQFGSATAMGGLNTLLLYAAVVGVLLALMDKFLRRRTETRLIVAICVAETVINCYERDISSLAVVLRGGAVFVAIHFLVALGRALLNSTQEQYPAHDLDKIPVRS